MSWLLFFRLIGSSTDRELYQVICRPNSKETAMEVNLVEKE